MSAEVLPPESTAEMGPRLAAAAIDTVFSILLWKLLSSVFDGSFVRTASVFLAYVVSHYGIIQGSTGATLGKGVMGLRLVDYAERSPGPVPALVRTALLLLDGAFIGITMMFLTPGHRRFGDALAGTWVVRDERGTDEPVEAVAMLSRVDEGSADEGSVDEGSVDEGSVDDGNVEGNAVEGNGSDAGRRRSKRLGRKKATAKPVAGMPTAVAAQPNTIPPGGVALAERPEHHDPFAKDEPSTEATQAPADDAQRVVDEPSVVEATPMVVHHEFVDVTNEEAAEHTFELLGSVLEAELPISGPEWDEARGSYVQWDPVNGRLMQYDYDTGEWSVA